LKRGCKSKREKEGNERVVEDDEGDEDICRYIIKEVPGLVVRRIWATGINELYSLGR
jgi:hypothetical protein